MKKLNSAGNDNVNECRQTTTTAETDLIRLRNFFWSNSTFLCSNRKRVQNFHFLFTNAICQNLHLVRFGLFGLQLCAVRCCHHILPESMLINRGFILYVDVCLRIGQWEPTKKTVGKRYFHVSLVVFFVVVLRRCLDGAFGYVCSEARKERERA